MSFQQQPYFVYVSSKVLASLNFDLIFHLNPFFVYASSKDSGEFAYMHGSPESSLLAISSDFGNRFKQVCDLFLYPFQM